MKINLKNIQNGGRTLADYLDFFFDKKNKLANNVPAAGYVCISRNANGDRRHGIIVNGMIENGSIGKATFHVWRSKEKDFETSHCVFPAMGTFVNDVKNVLPEYSFKTSPLLNAILSYDQNNKMVNPNTIRLPRMIWDIFDGVYRPPEEKRLSRQVEKLTKLVVPEEKIKKVTSCNKNYLVYQHENKQKVLEL